MLEKLRLFSKKVRPVEELNGNDFDGFDKDYEGYGYLKVERQPTVDVGIKLKGSLASTLIRFFSGVNATDSK